MSATIAPTVTIAHYPKCITARLIACIDIHLEALRVDYEKVANTRQVDNSQTLRKRMQEAYKQEATLWEHHDRPYMDVL